MSKFKLKRVGLIASIVLVIVIIGGIFGGLEAKKHQAVDSNDYNKIKSSHVMRWGVKGDTRLFGLISPKTGQSEGFDVDMARAITAQMAKNAGTKIKPEFTSVTTNSKIQLLKNHQVEAVAATMTITPERAKVIDFTKPYFPAGQSILVKKDSPIKDIKQLNSPKYTVITTIGTTAVQTMKQFAPKAKVISMPDNSQALSALESGQGVAVTTDNAILYGLADQNRSTKVVGKPFTNQPYGLAMNKNQPELRSAMNKALEQVIANGTYNKLIKKWFSHVPGLDWRSLEKW